MTVAADAERVTRRQRSRGRREAPEPQEIAQGVHLLGVGRGIATSNVYLVRSGEGWVLVDSGWAGSAAVIRTAAESLFGPGTRPAAVLLTHIHPDPSGSAGELARSWRVPVHAHPDELPMAAGRYLPEYGMPLDRWVVVPLMRLLTAGTRARITAAGDITDVAGPLDPAGRVRELPDWEWIAAPGHTPGQVAYRRRSDGVLLSGDALLTVDLNSVAGVLLGRQRLAGPPRYTTWNWPTAQRSAAALANLAPRVLGPGHGPAMTEGTAPALHAFARGDAAPRAEPSHRSLLGLRREPGRLATAIFRLPLKAYEHDAGRVMGRTFVAFTHVGRRTGQPHKTVAMVLRYDGTTGEVVVCAAWVRHTDWYRNLQVQPAVLVQLGGQTFAPEQRFLTEDEAFHVGLQFRRDHPHRLRFFSWVLGWGDLRDDLALREWVRARPFVAFRPAEAAADPAGA